MDLVLLAACSLVGTTAGIAFLIRRRYHSDYSGYLVRGLRELWWCLLVYIIVLTMFGFLLTLGMLAAFDTVHQSANGHSWIRALPFFLVGFVVALYPLFLEDVVTEQTTIERLKKAWFRTVIRLQGDLLNQIGDMLQILQQRDNYDRQLRRGSFDFQSLKPEEVDRRIRQLFQICKTEIANKNQDPMIMTLDVNVYPGQLFYALVRYLGRREFLSRMRTFQQPLDWQWVGNERRRERGTVSNRHVDLENPARGSDDSTLLTAITAGKACR